MVDWTKFRFMLDELESVDDDDFDFWKFVAKYHGRCIEANVTNRNEPEIVALSGNVLDKKKECCIRED